MGRIPNPKTNKKEEGPVAWLLSAMLLWFIAYPLYIFRRARYGLASHGWLCLAGAFIFVFLSFRIGLFVDSELTRIQVVQKQATVDYERAMRELEALQKQIP